MEQDAIAFVFRVTKQFAFLAQLALVVVLFRNTRKWYLVFFLAFLLIPLLQPALASYFVHLSKTMEQEDLMALTRRSIQGLYALAYLALLAGSACYFFDQARTRTTGSGRSRS